MRVEVDLVHGCGSSEGWSRVWYCSGFSSGSSSSSFIGSSNPRFAALLDSQVQVRSQSKARNDTIRIVTGKGLRSSGNTFIAIEPLPASQLKILNATLHPAFCFNRRTRAVIPKTKLTKEEIHTNKVRLTV